MFFYYLSKTVTWCQHIFFGTVSRYSW